MDIVTVDLPRAERSLSSISSDRPPQKYQPETLTPRNHTRAIYLPKFPAETFSVDNPLLLANLSGLSFCLNMSIHIEIVGGLI